MTKGRPRLNPPPATGPVEGATESRALEIQACSHVWRRASQGHRCTLCGVRVARIGGTWSWWVPLKRGRPRKVKS